MGPVIYALSALVTFFCAFLLLRAYTQARRRLLLWSGVCFAILTVSNLLVFMDLVLFPAIDLYLWRLGTTAIALLVLVYGLLWESE